MKKLFKSVLLTIQILFTHLAAAYITVGTDQDCDFQADEEPIQSLLDDGENSFRITNQVTFYESLYINKSVSFVGGFDSCSDARDLVYGDQKTTLNGNQIGPVIKINSPNDGTDQSVYFYGFSITNGINQPFHHGGGISSYDFNQNRINITIANSLIANNVGTRGGGISIKGDYIYANLVDTIVLNNQSFGAAGGSALGGGAYCSSGKLLLNEGSGIYGNHAYSTIQNAGYGGGIYATDSCEVILNSGTPGDLFDFRGISNNTASSHGGGIYAKNGARIFADSRINQVPININSNLADSSNTGYGDGGGIYLSGEGTYMQVIGLKSENNEAVNGGGIAAVNGALLLTAYATNCVNPKRCNEISNNRTATMNGHGGALYLNNGSAYISYAHLTNNKADLGSVLYGDNESSVVFSRSFVVENGSGGDDGWNDSSVYQMNGGDIIMSHITSANNQAVSATIRQYNGEHNVTNSIFYEPITNQIGNFVNSSGIKDCLLVDNNYGIGSGISDVLIDDPGLTADYHLTDGSLAIDRCSEIINNQYNEELDIDGEQAPFNDPNVSNGIGLLDMGADEHQPSDVIFSDAFETSN